MSIEAVTQVLERAMSDPAFREQLRSDPGHAVQGYDLSPEEQAALQQADEASLHALGVDERLSKGTFWR